MTQKALNDFCGNVEARVGGGYGIAPATLADTALRPARGSPSHFRIGVHNGMDTAMTMSMSSPSEPLLCASAAD